MTDVIEAGPANKGIPKGKMGLYILSDFIIFSFLSSLLSNIISSETINKIMPPAILRE